MKRRLAYALALAAALAGTVGAVAPVAAQPAVAQPDTPGRGGRRAMDQLAAIVQRRLGLSGEQALRLRQVTGRFAGQRQELLRQERDARRALRAQMNAGSAANQDETARRLDELLRVQQRRTELLASEQRELAAFLTPLQRAEFLAMQERAFRAAQQVQQRRAAGLRP